MKRFFINAAAVAVVLGVAGFALAKGHGGGHGGGGHSSGVSRGSSSRNSSMSRGSRGSSWDSRKGHESSKEYDKSHYSHDRDSYKDHDRDSSYRRDSDDHKYFDKMGRSEREDRDSKSEYKPKNGNPGTFPDYKNKNGGFEKNSSSSRDSASSFKDYKETRGTRFEGGYCYKGREHNHWSERCWNANYGCQTYWCPSVGSWYYWCQPDECYYPVSYCPYDTYEFDD